MVRSKSSGHLSESQSSLLSAPTGGERLASSSPHGERRFLGERYQPGERLLGASSGERFQVGERFQAGGESRISSSLPISIPPLRFFQPPYQPHHHQCHHHLFHGQFPHRHRSSPFPGPTSPPPPPPPRSQPGIKDVASFSPQPSSSSTSPIGLCSCGLRDHRCPN